MQLLRGNPTLRTILGVHFLFFAALTSQLILPKWCVALGYDKAQIGWLAGAPGVVSLSGTVLIGRWLDRVDRRRFVNAGLMLFVTTSLLTVAVARHFWPLLAVRAAQGASFALAFPALAVWTTEVTPPDRRVQAMGLFGVVSQLSQALAPLGGERIADTAGFPAFFAASAVAAASGWLWLRGGRRLLDAHESTRLRDAREAPRDEAPEPGAAAPRVWPFLLLVAGVGASYGAMLTFMPVFFLERGVPTVALFLTAVSGAAVLVRAGFGHLGDLVDRDRLIAGAALGVVVSLLAVAVAATLSFAPATGRLLQVGLGAAFGLAVGVFYPVANVRFVELGPPHARGRMMANYSSTYNSGLTLAALLLGGVLQWAGFRVGFAALAAAVGLALAAFVLSALRPARFAPAP